MATAEAAVRFHFSTQETSRVLRYEARKAATQVVDGILSQNSEDLEFGDELAF